MALSDFTHRCCADCWQLKFPGRPTAHEVIGELPLPCCFCGKATAANLFVREHPKSPTLKGCKGKHA